MPTTRTALTDEDIHTLIKGATADERAAAAHKLCRKMDRSELSDEDRQRADEILRVLAADAAELVRRALAVTLKSSPLVPRDVALKLAKDVDSIALPVLNFSPAFTDEDLVEIVRLAEPIRQVAIAKRPVLSEKVTGAIVEHAVEEAVEKACSNDKAQFAEKSLQSAIARFEKSERVIAAVAYRRVLPVSVTEKLVTMVGEQLRQHLVTHHQVSPATAIELALGSRERATVDLVDQVGRASDARSFASHLNKSNRLSPSLLLRCAAHGHMTFLEWAISELSGVPHHRTWLMIHDAGPLGLRAIYERAGLPARLFPAFRAAVDAFHAIEQEGRTIDRDSFQAQMLERFLTQPHTSNRDDVDYLLDKLDRLSPAAPAREAETRLSA
jgi:uncharacterized protein (DUF2336 family)